MRRLGPLYPGAVAIRQTTVMRWPGELRATADDSVRAAPWMVVVGAVLGVAAWLAGALIGALGVAPAVQGAVAIVALAALSAGLLDTGLARVFERWLARDDADELGRGIGAAGTSALLAAAVIRVIAIIATRPSVWLAALVIAPLVGRWAALALQRLGQVIDVPEPDRRSLVVGAVSWATLGVVTALVALLAVLGVGAAGLLLLILPAGLALAVGVVVERTRGGLDAPTLGAVAAACELIVFVGVAAIAPATASPWVF